MRSRLCFIHAVHIGQMDELIIYLEGGWREDREFPHPGLY